ncbi:hypothetical protein [Lachnobacterium bovis]|uniref:LPXTG-motif cell wall anchor domain-containing protein n=1 Tax=Lachnobacterium bovis TaxID=140626 RepID=A0A1H9UWJ1_9FIRM|nr:hypothetical protein [Lachnobacterium bovis]SES13910.1 hypothetical protein SAMN02910429_02295 [Lachnobacterium bovis]
MIRGLKKKLLIGLLSATVVGTSLAPNVPLVGSFAQEVKAEDSKLPEGMYKYTEETVSAVSKDNVYKWPTNGTHYSFNGETGAYTEISGDLTSPSRGYVFTESNTGEYVADVQKGFKERTDETQNFYTRSEETAVVDKDNSDYEWPESVVGKYKKVGNSYEKIENKEGVDVAAIKGATVKVYTREVDTTKSTVTLKPSTDTDKKVTVGSASIDGKSVDVTQESQPASAVIEKNKDTKVTLNLKATTGNTIKSVVAEIIDSATKKSLGKVTATKADGATDTYEFVIKATTAAVDVLINAQTEKLMITPKLNTTNLSPKVGTAALTSTDAVDTTGEFELKVTLEKGVTVNDSELKVVANSKEITGDEKNGVVTYKIPTEGVTDKELEIKVSGRLENDGLDKTADDKKGSTAEVAPTGKVAADANEVLEVAKSDLEDNQYVKAVLTIKEVAEEIEDALKTQIAARTNADENIELAGVIQIDLERYVADNPAALENAPKEDVTNLGALLTVHYVLPDEAQGKTDYKVISIHDSLREITTTPNEDGEYIEISGNSLILHVKKLSQFAILYNTADATTPEPEPIVPDEDKKPDTPVTPNPTVKPADTKAATSTKVAKVTTSTKKSTKTSSPKTADYAVNSLLALLTGAAGLFGITLVNKKRKEDEE